MKLFLLFSFISSFVFSSGQISYYSNPVKIPVLLSANFGELRSNHFHTGIDIKLQGQVGIPVYSAADGYISRIAVSPVGYGKVLYIDHPNGTTTVYGHLDKFREDIDKYVKKIQYEKKSFALDISLDSDEFKVKKGEIIAKGGNSGSSNGPHLHFEIRDTESEEALNPLTFRFKVNDKTAPRLKSIMIAPLDDVSFVNNSRKKEIIPLIQMNNRYVLKNNQPVQVSGRIGFALEGYDLIDGSANLCGIYAVKCKINGTLFFSYKFDSFSFSNSRYINSHIVYSEYVKSGRRFQKTWIDPGNRLGVYYFTWEKGVLKPENGKTYQVELEITDANGNKTVADFQVTGKMTGGLPEPNDYTELFRYNEGNSYKTDNFQMTIPKGALYDNLKFRFAELDGLNGYYSDFYVVGDNSTPIHKNIAIKIRTKNLPENMEGKATIVSVDKQTGRYTSFGGSVKNGWMSAQVPEFGTFAVRIDTVPPSIIPVNLKNGKLTESNSIKFKIIDDFTGIREIEATLDGKWMLFDYDKKRDLITHLFDAERFELKKRHDFSLAVTDIKGNRSIYETSFWK